MHSHPSGVTSTHPEADRPGKGKRASDVTGKRGWFNPYFTPLCVLFYRNLDLYQLFLFHFIKHELQNTEEMNRW